jgi:hemoglobin-like flavoprotein
VGRDSAARELANASYQRCCESPGFFAAFYRNFFEACPAAVPRFAGTDFERQHKLLRHAVGVLLIFPKEPEAEPTVLTRIAERRSRRDLAVPPSLYAPFVDSLIVTVEQHDPAVTPEVEHTWHRRNGRRLHDFPVLGGARR